MTIFIQQNIPFRFICVEDLALKNKCHCSKQNIYILPFAGARSCIDHLVYPKSNP